MTEKQDLGRLAEDAALEFLRQNGLRLVERNFRCRMGEVDLIMTEGDTLVFVEVRYRRNVRFVSGAESVDWRKRRKLVRTAQHFLGMRPQHGRCNCRFDVISASSGARNGGSQLALNWVRGAFESDG